MRAAAPETTPASRRPLLDLAALALAAAVSVAVLTFAYAGPGTQFEEMGLGPETTSLYARVDGHPIHCSGVEDAPACLAGFAARGARRAVLWVGNSQLHGVNQLKPGDQSAPALLFPRLSARGIDLLAFSQPNANLQEHYVLFTWLRKRLPLELLLLPVVFDDLRETGVRFNLAPALQDPAVLAELERRPAGQRIVQNAGDLAAGELAGVRETVQEQVEARLTSWLGAHWRLWANRPEARGMLMHHVWQTRNLLFGITPQSKRRMVPGSYDLNLAAAEAILADAREAGVAVILYVVPIRDDVESPYEPEPYARFKDEIERMASAQGATFLNLERLVSGRFWGTRRSQSLGKDVEIDFMHFQAQGHHLLAEAVGPSVEEVLDRRSS